MMKKILVATDFSTCAGNAMEYALELAKSLQLGLCVIHAIGPTEGINNSTYNAIYIEDYYNNKRQALAAWASTFKAGGSFKEVMIDTLCDVGSLSAVISKYILANPVELLVMGTMGATGITGLFGSNASMMVEKTKIPTLVIPLESKFSKDSVITLATDFSTTLSSEDVVALNELMKALSSKKMNVINIVETPEWSTNTAGEDNLKKLIFNAELEFKYLSESNPTNGIMKFIVSKHTDILCLVKHHHNLVYRIFNRSTVNQVMNRSIKAVLVLHE